MTISFSSSKNGQDSNPISPPVRAERSVDFHARIGVVLAICVLTIEVAGIAVLSRVVAWFGGTLPLADALVVAMAVAMVIGGLYGFRWTRNNVLRVWSHEDEDRDWARGVGYNGVQEVEIVEQVVPFPSGEAIRSVAARLLTLHHTGQNKDEKDCTRPWCISNQVCSDDEWEFANKVLQAIHAKKARGWADIEVAPNYQDAMAKLYKASFEPDGYNAQVNGQFVRFRDYPLTNGARRA